MLPIWWFARYRQPKKKKSGLSCVSCISFMISAFISSTNFVWNKKNKEVENWGEKRKKENVWCSTEQFASSRAKGFT